MVLPLLDKPTLGPCRMDLRPYQEEAIGAVRNEFAAGRRSTLLVMATGLGKTIVMGMIARRAIEKGGRVLVLAHRGELIEQAADKFDRLGVEPGIEKAEQYANAIFEPDAVIATVQTMQRQRLANWAPDHFRLIMTDEAHHATAESYRRIYKHFSGARHLGVTATPDRADEENLGQIYESVAYEFNLFDAIQAPPPGPYLCRLKIVQCDLQIDLRGIRTTGGDFNLGDLEERIRPLVDMLANAIRQEIGERRTLVFTPDVGSAQAIATALQAIGFRAEWTAGDDGLRREKIRRFKAGDFQVLTNCALLLEGFDSPEVAAVVLCRPTRSRALMSQMVGRGTRLAAGKEDCLVVDFDYLTAKHSLVKPVELVDTTQTDDEILQIADEIIRKEKGVDLLEAVQRAEKTHNERQVVRIKAREREVRYRRVSYNPVAVYDTLGLPWRGPKATDAVINKATPKQVEWLKKMGVEDAGNISKTRASTMIDVLKRRMDLGLATMKQTAWLINRGIDADAARKMTKDEASEKLSEFFGKRERDKAG